MKRNTKFNQTFGIRMARIREERADARRKEERELTNRLYGATKVTETKRVWTFPGDWLVTAVRTIDGMDREAVLEYDKEKNVLVLKAVKRVAA